MLSASGPPPNNPSKPKRVIRKCSHQNCNNRAVQGGVCITHGARRKCCVNPRCDKAVKPSGYCSAHGPSWRKCDHEGGCSRVAVQGGRCISRGARKRVCCYPGGLSDGENRGGAGTMRQERHFRGNVQEASRQDGRGEGDARRHGTGRGLWHRGRGRRRLGDDKGRFFLICETLCFFTKQLIRCVCVVESIVCMQDNLSCPLCRNRVRCVTSCFSCCPHCHHCLSLESRSSLSKSFIIDNDGSPC